MYGSTYRKCPEGSTTVVPGAGARRGWGTCWLKRTAPLREGQVHSKVDCGDGRTCLKVLKTTGSSTLNRHVVWRVD